MLWESVSTIWETLVSRIALVAMARTGSNRLPNKVLYDLGGKPAFIHIIERITSVIDPDFVLVATTNDSSDDPIELFARQYGIGCFRGPEDPCMRFVMAGDSLGLKDEDFFLYPSCDSVLTIYKHMPFVINQMREHGCGACCFAVPEGTLLDAFWFHREIGVWEYERKRISAGHRFHGNILHHQSYHVGCPRTLIVNFPPEYLVPWPWGDLALDHESQAGVLKEIYRQLYEGSPIDPFDVRDFLEREPLFAYAIPRDLPKTSAAISVSSDQDLQRRSAILNTDCVEVTWKGGDDVVLKLAEDSKTNLGGD